MHSDIPYMVSVVALCLQDMTGDVVYMDRTFVSEIRWLLAMVIERVN